MSGDSGATGGLPAGHQRRNSRAMGTVSSALLEQQENLAALAAQCARGRALVNRPAGQEPNYTQVERKIANLERLWNACDWTHRDLFSMAESADVASYLATTTFSTARDGYYDVVERLEGVLETIRRPASTANPPPVDAPVRSQLPALERLPVPTFDGMLKDWPNFRDLFQVLVINDASIGNVYKLSYLKRSLKGNALALIKNLEVNGENFTRAWKLLTDHYQNVNSLTFSHIVRLLKLEPVDSRKPGNLERLFIQTREILASLEALAEPVKQWSSLLVVLTLLRLDPELRQAWEHSLGKRETFPKFSELEDFLQTRIHSDSISFIRPGVTTHSASALPAKSQKVTDSREKFSSHLLTASAKSCVLCNSGTHAIQSCEGLIALSMSDRLAKLKSLRLCFNCLKRGHLPRDCRSNSRCVQCRRRHHTLIHEALNNESNPAVSQNVTSSPPLNVTIATVNASHGSYQSSHDKINQDRHVLLATAIIHVSTNEGRKMTVRALIDQGSERSFVSESVAQFLCASRKAVNASIIGIGGVTPSRVRHISSFRLSSAISDQSIHVDCLILPKLTSYAPRQYVTQGMWQHVCHLPLADSELHSDRNIEMILGADVYGEIIREGVVKFPNEPIAQFTIFGWILSGPCNSRVSSDLQASSSPSVFNSLHIVTNDELDVSLRRFWELEDTVSEKYLTREEQRCEEIFTNTTRRDDQGRFIVNLPFKTDLPIDIGESYATAYKQYVRLERRLSNDQELSHAYESFLQEYLDLGHMVPYSPQSDTEQRYYIPHHPVFKEASSTTKVRVVFNASSPSSNGRSLNDNLLIGPKLQQDLASIILRWRLHKYVMVADAEKMFRQIRISHEHTRFQLILWRPRGTESLRTYQLQTVTYGTTSAPYLSLRVLYQLASDERTRFPLASHELLENTYVDDIVFGASSLELTKATRDQVLSLTRQGGFTFRKWISNHCSLLSDLPADLRDASVEKEFIVDEGRKVLGISWVTSEDCFRYSTVPDAPSLLTKRTILSFIAKLYDPMGWVAPVLVSAKIFMQRLWLTQLGWDDLIPSDLAASWQNYAVGLSQLQNLQIPRWVGMLPGSHVQLHMFCDASQHAYAAAVYLRVEEGSEVFTYLLVSKTKVAPIKTITIPRLELCSAELGSRLLSWTLASLPGSNVPVFAWTDSEISLIWITASPSRWKLFIANRVSRIQTRCPQVSWHYVPSALNPADVASRGCTAESIKDDSLWWHGPDWLRSPRDEWPSAQPDRDPTVDYEERPIAVHLTQLQFCDLAQRSSNWGKLIRAAATFFRYLDILKRRIRHQSVETLTSPSATLVLQYRERAQLFWIKVAQSQCFALELPILKANGSLPRRNRLVGLDPYIDQDGIVRVGGRLDNSLLRMEGKHPILLSTNYITQLIIKNAHHRTLHGGVTLVSRLLAEKYWIFRAKILVKSAILQCVPCTRYRASVLSQKMAPLPSFRVQRRRAFQNVGVDYAGPLNVKFGIGRGYRAHKAYIAVFVCLGTRAIHLELVHACSSDAFLAAFRRFSSRRGLPSLVISDNGTNFLGASRELAREFKRALADARIAAVLANDQVEWRFIPPGSPHFGGMWESGVKSVKHHLRRVAGDHTLNVEEMGTLLCQIEACLNSRPIAGFSNSPDDLSYLTPGHFLIGTALLTLPEPSVLHQEENRLSRWKLIQRMAEHFWKVWSCDYLRSLQTRNKWRTPQSNLEVGAIVLIKNENLPPAKWALGRITECIPGADGLTRVCKIRTASTVLTRAVHKLCVLPVDSAPIIDSKEF